MDIQGYILDRWMAKMKAESPVLTIYDKDGLYYDILPLAQKRVSKSLIQQKVYCMQDCLLHVFGQMNCL